MSEQERKIEFSHRSVLLDECIEGLDIKADGVYVDGTAGGGGHSSEIAARLRDGRLIAIDQDETAVAVVSERLARFGERVTVVRNNFCENADVCIFTTDNPRYELPSSILDNMLEGVKDFDNYLVIENRTDAINLAIKAAENNDCVVICGKGGENYIETQGRRLPYSDFDAVEKAKNFA